MARDLVAWNLRQGTVATFTLTARRILTIKVCHERQNTTDDRATRAGQTASSGRVARQKQRTRHHTQRESQVARTRWRSRAANGRECETARGIYSTPWKGP